MISPAMAVKNLRYRWKRYAFLVSALSLGFALILVLSGLSGGMARSVNKAAVRRYGGNLFVLGHQQSPYYTPVVRDHAALLAAAKEARIDATLIVRRTNYFENGLIFFNGYSARQKVISGIDWTVEEPVFSDMDFITGGKAGMAGSEGILISQITAKEIQARVGDDVLLEVDTVTGQRNTATLVVRGIFSDASIFGAYVSYMDIAALNRLIGLSPDEYTILGIYLRHPETAGPDASRLYATLSKRVPMFAPVATQPELWTRLGERWAGVKYAVLTLNGYLAEIEDLISAVDLGLYLLLILMLAIIVLGIGNAYRVIVHERTREFGTMRALGMPLAGISRLIVLETLLLSVIGISAGSLIGFSILQVIGSVPAPRIPGFDIFLQKGRLGWHLAPLIFPLDALSVIVAVLIGGLMPARRASSVMPAKALRLDA
jgi:putative ABC transport system permease protein